MNYLKRKFSMFVLASILATGAMSSAIAAIAFSGESVNSLSISSTRSENNSHYLLEIYIKGIPTSDVTFEIGYQTLFLQAKTGGMITDGAIAGAQVVNLMFHFPTNADLKSYFRENKPNKIIISVPKSKFL